MTPRPTVEELMPQRYQVDADTYTTDSAFGEWCRAGDVRAALERALAQQDERRCPICEGRGLLLYPAGVAHGQETFHLVADHAGVVVRLECLAASDGGPWKCRRCDGRGTIFAALAQNDTAPPTDLIERVAQALFEADRDELETDAQTWDDVIARNCDGAYRRSAVKILDVVRGLPERLRSARHEALLPCDGVP